MEKLKVFALDDDRNRASGAIPYISLLWSRRYYEPSSFIMQIDANVYNSKWKYIYCPNRPETMIIEKVAIADTQRTKDGIDIITLSGRSLESRLDDFVFLVEETETEQHYVSPPRIITTTKNRTISQGTAYLSDGGYLYTFNSSGELEGHTPAGVDGKSQTKNLAKTEMNADGSITVTDLTGSVYTVKPITYESSSNVFNYKTVDDDTAKITSYRQTGMGDYYEQTYSRYYTDDSGGTYYYGGDMETTGEVLNPTWHRETGVTDKVEDTYYYQRRVWNQRIKDEGLIQDGLGNYYKNVKVKGAWQRTEVEDVGKEMDCIQQLMLYARMYFQNDVIYEEPDFEGEVKVLNPSLKSLMNVLYDELRTQGASFSVIYDFEQDTCVFRIWKGLNRTQSQTENRWAVFNDKWGTLYDYICSTDTKDYRNKCFVLYDFQAPVIQNGNFVIENNYKWDDSGTSRTLEGYRLKTTQKRGYETVRLDDGLEDREVFLDLRGREFENVPDFKIEYSLEEGKPTFSKETVQMVQSSMDFQSVGKSYLMNNHPVKNVLDTGIIKTDDYLLKWDLGDYVDMAIYKMEMAKEARITGVDESYTANKAYASVIINDEIVKAVSNG